MSRLEWKNASAYPNETSYMESSRLEGDKLYTSKAWAWQFLRRNPNYQSDYAELRRIGSHKLGEEIASRYGMTMMLPFTDDEPDLIPFRNTLAIQQLDNSSRKPFNLSNSQLALVFDLSLPIPAQLELAKAQISEEILRRKISFPLKRKRKQEFVRYLRIIDAKKCGITNRVIAEQFIAEGIYSLSNRSSDNYYPAQSLIEQDWHVAKRLMEDGYIAIAYS